MHAFSFDHAGIDGVNANLLWSQLARQHTGNGVDGALGAGINGGCRWGNAADNGADIDDATALADVLERRLVVSSKPSTLMLNILWNCSSVNGLQSGQTRKRRSY